MRKRTLKAQTREADTVLGEQILPWFTEVAPRTGSIQILFSVLEATWWRVAQSHKLLRSIPWFYSEEWRGQSQSTPRLEAGGKGTLSHFLLILSLCPAFLSSQPPRSQFWEFHSQLCRSRHVKCSPRRFLSPRSISTNDSQPQSWGPHVPLSLREATIASRVRAGWLATHAVSHGLGVRWCLNPSELIGNHGLGPIPQTYWTSELTVQ